MAKDWRKIGFEILHWTRAILSLILYFACMGIVFYAIAEEKTAFFPQIPFYVNYIILFVFLVLLGIFEGSQICFIELMKQPPEAYKNEYKYAWSVVRLCLKPNNLERFLVGRQIVVFLLTFFLARLTTISNTGVFPYWFETGLLSTGLFGAILTTITGQLVPRIVALGFPVQFINNPIVSFAFRICLWIEFTGIAYSSWIIASVVSFITRLKSRAKKGRAEEVLEEKPNDTNQVSLWDQINNEDPSAYFSYFTENPLSIELNDEAKERVRSMSSSELLEFKSESASYPSSSEIAELLKNEGISQDDMPTFLLDPSNPRHVPAYIFACTQLGKIGKERKIEASIAMKFIDHTPEQFSGVDDQAIADALVACLVPPSSVVQKI